MMLTGKNAVVTGSTSGIGLAIARGLAKQGANVMINGIGNPEENEAIRKSIEADFAVQVLFSVANMLKPDQIAGMITEAEQAFGTVDILVNNAGVQFVSPVEDFPEDKWNATIAINLTAAFHSIKAVIPGMSQRGWGRIINTASAHALVASPYKSAYVTAINPAA